MTRPPNHSDDPLDHVGDYGDVAKADYRDVWLQVCREELAGADERRRKLLAEFDAAVARHPSAQTFDDAPRPRPVETVDVKDDRL